MPPRIVVCVPTYLEVENVEPLLRGIRAALPDADVLLADDSSPDGTAGVARRIAAELGRIEVVTNDRKVGLGEAYRRAFRVVFERDYDVICQIDADLSHDPAVLPSLVAAVEDGCSLAIGSRYVPGGSITEWPWYRRALSRYGNRYAAAVLGIKIADATSAYRAFAADALKAIDVFTTRATGYGFQIECAYRAHQLGLPVREVPIVFADRQRGRSKLGPAVAVEELTLVTWWGVRDRMRRLRHRALR